MSRIGNRVLTIPAGVEVNVEGNKVTTKGPKGTLEFTFKNSNVDVKVEGTEVHVSRKDDTDSCCLSVQCDWYKNKWQMDDDNYCSAHHD